MTRIPIETGPKSGSFSARWAVLLAMAVAIFDAVTIAIMAGAYAIGGSDAISDNWVGFLGGIALIGGPVVSLVAFVMALVTKIKSGRWLWLPLLTFPALIAFTVLGEVFWWE